MSVDPASFRQALSQFASGVTVVTTRAADGKPLGLTVSSFCSVSLAPPMVLVCVDRRSEAHTGFQASGIFGVPQDTKVLPSVGSPRTKCLGSSGLGTFHGPL